MVKKIIACSDIHILNFKRIDEISDILTKFIDSCKDIAKDYNKDEIRIVIAGDIFQSKIEISNEANIMAGWFFKQLNEIAKTIVIAGNHDMLMNNTSRLDSLTPIFTLSNFSNTLFLDKELNYESGCLVDDNIVWCLYSSFSNFEKPNINEFKENYPDKTFIGLFHGEIKGSKTDTGRVMENGFDSNFFSDIDFGILGHIHKRQCIKKNGVNLVYCGSLLQQDYGENLTGHGYVVWDVLNKTFNEYDIENNNKFYLFQINNYEDIDNDKEELINL